MPDSHADKAHEAKKVQGLGRMHESSQPFAYPCSGADGRIRTDGLLFTKQLLYR